MYSTYHFSVAKPNDRHLSVPGRGASYVNAIHEYNAPTIFKGRQAGKINF